MVVGSENNDKKKEVDASLQKWCQGDFVLSEQWFVHRFNPQLPLTIVSEEIPTEVNEEVSALLVTYTIFKLKFNCRYGV